MSSHYKKAMENGGSYSELVDRKLPNRFKQLAGPQWAEVSVQETVRVTHTALPPDQWTLGYPITRRSEVVILRIEQIKTKYREAMFWETSTVEAPGPDGTTVRLIPDTKVYSAQFAEFVTLAAMLKNGEFTLKDVSPELVSKASELSEEEYRDSCAVVMHLWPEFIVGAGYIYTPYMPPVVTNVWTGQTSTDAATIFTYTDGD